MAIGQIISAALGGAQQTLGTALAQKKLKELNDERRQNNTNYDAFATNWYNQKRTEDPMMRADSQNVLRKQRELLDEQYKRARAINLVAGGTDESLALQQQAANNTMGETMADMAANFADRRDAYDAQFLAHKGNMNQIYNAELTNQANQVAAAASQSAKSGANLLASGLEGLTNTIQKKTV